MTEGTPRTDDLTTSSSLGLTEHKATKLALKTDKMIGGGTDSWQTDRYRNSIGQLQ